MGAVHGLSRPETGVVDSTTRLYIVCLGLKPVFKGVTSHSRASLERIMTYHGDAEAPELCA